MGSEDRKHERERIARDTQRYGREVGSEIGRQRRPRVGKVRPFLVCMMAFALLAGCVSEPVTEPEATLADQSLSTSADLIAEALETGEIDEPTSLLYRTWLFFGDSKLPEKFTGEEAPYEYGLISKVRNKLDGLPADVRAQIEPYLLRPDDPRSVFNMPDPGSEAGSTVALASAIQPVADEEDEPEQCSTNWLTEAIVGLPFRVWVCDDPAALSGFTPTEALDLTGDMIMEYAPQMLADMGELIPDDPSMQSGEIADNLIDVYALPTGWLGPYRENYSSTPNYARTVQSPPTVGNATSSYILMSLDHAQDRPLLDRIMVHELFHVFQNAFHAKLNAPWWTEGSAEWSASYYVPSDSQRLHEARMEWVMDTTAPSILLDGELSVYGGYIWPFFMEQQEGADAIFDSLSALAKLPADAGTEAVIAVLDKQVPMSANYPELAVRIVNMQLAGDPITPKFQDLDPNFPTGRQPQMYALTLGRESLELNADALYGLGYRDYRITVVPPPDHPADTGVLVRVSGGVQTGSGRAPVLQALVRNPDGEYSRVQLAYTGDGDSVCVDEDMILVLANDSTVKFDLTEGSLVLQRLDGEPCSTIEVNDPDLFEALLDGDTVQVDGIEGDNEPDDTRLVVTVRDPDPSEIDEYEVKVQVTGGTLRSPRTFTWPLSSLEDLGMGVWRQDVPMPLDIDLTDANRPLTIDASLERLGASIDFNSPTVMLHGEQESLCFVDADISGQVMHQIYLSGSTSEYRAYPVDVSRRFEHPAIIRLVTLSDYTSTVLEFMTAGPGQSDLFEQDQFHFTANSFGLEVPSGTTGTYALETTLAYRDYTNVPWASLDEDTPLPNQGLGQPLPGDALTMLRGDATIHVTRSLPSEGILEGTITGLFTDEHAYDHGTRLDVTLTFATADEC